jgi:hypothetical protein
LIPALVVLPKSARERSLGGLVRSVGKSVTMLNTENEASPETVRAAFSHWSASLDPDWFFSLLSQKRKMNDGGHVNVFFG